MDMFMDKLAQKLNAQEIIRANTAAELEELDRLKSRVAEYNECLDRLQLLVSESTAGFRAMSEADAAQVQSLAEKSLEKIREIQQDSARLEQLSEQLTAVDENVHKECVKVYRNVQAVVVEESGRQGEALAALSGKLDAVKGRTGLLLGISLVAMLSSLAMTALQVLGWLDIKLY